MQRRTFLKFIAVTTATVLVGKTNTKENKLYLGAVKSVAIYDTISWDDAAKTLTVNGIKPVKILVTHGFRSMNFTEITKGNPINACNISGLDCDGDVIMLYGMYDVKMHKDGTILSVTIT